MSEARLQKQFERLQAEVSRVNPQLHMPARDEHELKAIDDIMIFGEEYHKWTVHEGQIPEYACTIKYFPSDTMLKHAGLYGMYWQIGEDQRGELDRVWFLQKEDK